MLGSESPENESQMNPTKKLTDPDFVYRNAANTDVKATFAKIYREMKREKPKPAAIPIRGRRI